MGTSVNIAGKRFPNLENATGIAAQAVAYFVIYPNPTLKNISPKYGRGGQHGRGTIS